MGGGSSESTTTSSQSREPWAPAIPYLEQLLGKVGNQMGNTGLTGRENSALNQLQRLSNQPVQNVGQMRDLTRDLFRTKDYSGNVMSGYEDYKAALSPFASGEYVDPTKNAQLQGYLSTIQNDVANRTNAMFAGAGRDLSGANQNALARGISEGTAPVLYNAYNDERNRQLSAIDNIYNGGNTAATTAAGLNKLANDQRMLGYQSQQAMTAAQSAPALMQLQVEAMRRGIPMQNLGQIASMLLPLGQMGGSSYGSSTTESEQSPSLMSSIFGGLSGGLGLLGNLGLFSDARLKEDIEPIGKLNDGQPIYRYKYKGDPTVRMGLLAQLVEQNAPDAVHEIGGYKAVDYGAATDRAAEMGEAA